MYTLNDIQYANFAKQKKNNTKRNLLIGAGVLGSAALLAGGLALTRGKGGSVIKSVGNTSDDISKTVVKNTSNKVDNVVKTVDNKTTYVEVPKQTQTIKTLNNITDDIKPPTVNISSLTKEIEIEGHTRKLSNGRTVRVKGYRKKGLSKKEVENIRKNKKVKSKIEDVFQQTIGKTYDDELNILKSDIGKQLINGTPEQKELFKKRYITAFESKFDDLIDESIDLYNDNRSGKEFLIKQARELEDKLKKLNDNTLLEFSDESFYQNKKVFEKHNAKIKRHLNQVYKNLQTISDDIQPSTYSKKVLNGTYKKELDGKDINELLEWENFIKTNKEFNEASNFSQIGDSKHYINSLLSSMSKGNTRIIKDIDGKLQAAVTLSKDYTDNQGKSYVRIHYLATAPHNVLPNHPDKVKGSGSAIIAKLIEESIEKGYGGRLMIDGMSGSSLKFYERIGFKGNTLDEKAAQEFLKKLKSGAIE